MFQIVRFSSSLASLWVKHNTSQPFQLSTFGCVNISDLTEAIKKLPAYHDNQITLHKSLTDPALDPTLQISSISAAGLSDKLPLIIKTQEIHKFDIVMFSNIAQSDKLSILKDLSQVQSLKDLQQQKEKEVEWLKERVFELQQQKEKEVQLLRDLQQEKEKEVEWLKEQKDSETAYKLHYMQLLSVRGLIEEYEKNFGESLRKKRTSRFEKWKTYLESGKEKFRPFEEAGFTVDQVCHHVDTIYNSHSADVHSLKLVEGLVLKVKGKLTLDQMKVVQIINEESRWKDIISIE